MCEMEICFCMCVHVFKEPQIKEKNTGRKRPIFKGKTLCSYWQCFLHFWVISVVLLPVFLVLTDNWQNINHMQQTAQLQGRRHVQQSKTSVVFVRFQCLSWETKRRSIFSLQSVLIMNNLKGRSLLFTPTLLVPIFILLTIFSST